MVAVCAFAFYEHALDTIALKLPGAMPRRDFCATFTCLANRAWQGFDARTLAQKAAGGQETADYQTESGFQLLRHAGGECRRQCGVAAESNDVAMRNTGAACSGRDERDQTSRGRNSTPNLSRRRPRISPGGYATWSSGGRSLGLRATTSADCVSSSRAVDQRQCQRRARRPGG